MCQTHLYKVYPLANQILVDGLEDSVYAKDADANLDPKLGVIHFVSSRIFLADSTKVLKRFDSYSAM